MKTKICYTITVLCFIWLCVVALAAENGTLSWTAVFIHTIIALPLALASLYVGGELE